MSETQTDPADNIDAAQAEADVIADPTPITIEDVAADMGWSPKEKWRGDPDKWRDAGAFVKATVDVNRSLSKEVKGLKDTTERMARVTETVVAKARADALAEAEAKFKQAVDDGDTAAARRASVEIDKIAAAETVVNDSESTFASRNPWYGKDQDATDYAVSVSQRLARDGKSHDEQLEAAEAAVKKRFPELFEDAPQRQRKDPPGVSSPTRSSGTRAKGAADLPADAISAAKTYIKMGVYKNEAEYAKAYWAENS